MMHHALPMVGHDVGGISEWLLDGEVGYLVPPFRPKLLAEKLDFILSSPQRAAQMGQRALTWARSFPDVSAYVEQVEGLLLRAVRGKAGVRPNLGASQRSISLRALQEEASIADLSENIG